MISLKLYRLCELVLLVLSFNAFVIVTSNPDSKRLYAELLSTYNKVVRPVGNNSDRLTIKLGLKLSQLIDVVSQIEFTCYNMTDAKVVSNLT